jgi:hypothetical protein
MTYRDDIETARTRYLHDTEGFELAVKHDHGLYRHLLYKKPGSSMYWLEVLTSPGLLTINGDMGTFTFSRLTDMFEFFGTKEINPQYWAEKLRPHPHEVKYQDYSQKVFTEWLGQDFEDRRIEYDLDGQAVISAALTAALADDFDNDITTAAGAVRLLNETKIRTVDPPWEYHDTWEYEWNAYSIFYLWNLHAIVDIIGKYRARKAVNPE